MIVRLQEIYDPNSVVQMVINVTLVLYELLSPWLQVLCCLSVKCSQLRDFILEPSGQTT